MIEEQLKYPIGKFKVPAEYTSEAIAGWINDIKELPANLRNTVTGLTDAQLDTPYRPDGWTTRQVVHHIADSHINSIIRFKWALTEDQPTIKVYNQTDWANLPDSKLPIEPSLLILEGVHQRMVALYNSMNDVDWNRTFIHPEAGIMDLKRLLALYAWHGKHHLAHITNALNNK